MFLIDLPRLPNEELDKPQDLTQFAKDLFYYCDKAGYASDKTTLAMLRKYNWSKTSKYAFVHSIGGANFGDDCKRTGFAGLANAVKNLGLGVQPGAKCDFVTSSLGTLNADLLTKMYKAAMGMFFPQLS